VLTIIIYKETIIFNNNNNNFTQGTLRFHRVTSSFSEGFFPQILGGVTG